MQRVSTSALRRHIDNSPKLRELRLKRRKKRVRILVLFLILLLSFLGLFIALSRNYHFQIQTVVLSGNDVTDDEEILSVVEKHLSGHYAYIVPKRNAFLYPRDEIIFDIHEIFPRLRDVEIKREGKNKVSISMREVRGDALWCGRDTVLIDTNHTCYFTDSTGVVVSEAPYYSGNVYRKFYGGTISTEPLGKEFVTKERFNDLLTFADGIESLGFPVLAIGVGNGEDSTLIVDTEKPRAVIRFRNDDPYGEILSNLGAALSKDELKTELENKKLEYFDLRFTNKVYYRFR